MGQTRDVPRPVRWRGPQGPGFLQVQLLGHHRRKVVMSKIRILHTALAAMLSVALVSPASAQTAAEIEEALKAAHSKYQNLKEGKNADYIPALAKVDSNIYGIALVTVDGRVYTMGDIKSEVSIQSISKVFTMALVMEESGVDSIPAN